MQHMTPIAYLKAVIQSNLLFEPNFKTKMFDIFFMTKALHACSPWTNWIRKSASKYFVFMPILHGFLCPQDWCVFTKFWLRVIFEDVGVFFPQLIT